MAHGQNSFLQMFFLPLAFLFLFETSFIYIFLIPLIGAKFYSYYLASTRLPYLDLRNILSSNLILCELILVAFRVTLSSSSEGYLIVEGGQLDQGINRKYKGTVVRVLWH